MWGLFLTFLFSEWTPSYNCSHTLYIMYEILCKGELYTFISVEEPASMKIVGGVMGIHLAPIGCCTCAKLSARVP